MDRADRPRIQAGAGRICGRDRPRAKRELIIEWLMTIAVLGGLLFDVYAVRNGQKPVFFTSVEQPK